MQPTASVRLVGSMVEGWTDKMGRLAYNPAGLFDLSPGVTPPPPRLVSGYRPLVILVLWHHAGQDMEGLLHLQECGAQEEGQLLSE